MRKKIYDILNKVYGILLTVSFFGGAIPIIPFIIALIIGGPFAQTLCTFLYEKYYTVIISMASIGILVGWIAMYVDKKEKI